MEDVEPEHTAPPAAVAAMKILKTTGAHTGIANRLKDATLVGWTYVMIVSVINVKCALRLIVQIVIAIVSTNAHCFSQYLTVIINLGYGKISQAISDNSIMNYMSFCKYEHGGITVNQN